MEVKDLRLLERAVEGLVMLQRRLDALSAAVGSMQRRQAAFEDAVLDSLTLLWDEMPRGKGVRHGTR